MGICSSLAVRVAAQTVKEHLSKCDRCEAMRPPRCHHCRLCRGCILEFDHHCTALGTRASRTVLLQGRGRSALR
jgi:hypothetical protein